MKGLVIRNTHMKYESSIFNGLKVMAKFKVFVYAANADGDVDTDADAKDYDISFPQIHPGSLKIALSQFLEEHIKEPFKIS